MEDGTGETKKETGKQLRMNKLVQAKANRSCGAGDNENRLG